MPCPSPLLQIRNVMFCWTITKGVLDAMGPLEEAVARVVATRAVASSRRSSSRRSWQQGCSQVLQRLWCSRSSSDTATAEGKGSSGNASVDSRPVQLAAIGSSTVQKQPGRGQAKEAAASGGPLPEPSSSLAAAASSDSLMAWQRSRTESILVASESMCREQPQEQAEQAVQDPAAQEQLEQQHTSSVQLLKHQFGFLWPLLWALLASSILWRLRLLFSQDLPALASWAAVKVQLGSRRGQFGLKYFGTIMTALVMTLVLAQHVPLVHEARAYYAFTGCCATMMEKAETTVSRMVLRVLGTVLGGVVGAERVSAIW
jgi:hypothetical protein